jgi:hypothetical protein
MRKPGTRTSFRFAPALAPVLGLAAGLAVWPAVSGEAQERVIGLLPLPEVFGEGPCDRFDPREVRLEPAPDTGRVVGWIRVDRYWTFHEAGGCAGLAVNVHDARTGEVAPLPTREYGYEQPAAVALRERDGWVLVRLAEGAAWVRTSRKPAFLPLEELLEEGLTFLTDAWDGRLATAPDAEAPEVPREGAAAAALARPAPPVRTLGFHRDPEGSLHVEVQVMSHSVCEPMEEEPRVVARGWVLAHARAGARAGEPAVWFFPRGC